MHPKDEFVTVPDGVRLCSVVAGGGPRTVLVPNGGYLVDDLAPLAAGRRVVFVDLRNRGRSDASDACGILQDVEDVRAVARHFAPDSVDIVGHSYAALIGPLLARADPGLVRRVVLLAPMPADPDRQYPAALVNHDDTFARVMAALAALQRERASHGPVEYCEKVWAALGPLYVTEPKNAARIRWGRCHLANERGALRYFLERVLPSIRALGPDGSAWRDVAAPALVVHGTKDRSAPYGAGREWAASLANARLLSVPDGGHAPWIEATNAVFGALEAFLGGRWPDQAEMVAEHPQP